MSSTFFLLAHLPPCNHGPRHLRVVLYFIDLDISIKNMHGVTYHLHKGIAMLQLCAPPMNSLSHTLRSDLLRGLERAQKDRAAAIILTGTGKSFCAGADITEFARGKHNLVPALTDVITALDEVDIPTIAGLHGYCLGGGLELALACHWRYADLSAKLGLPEVHLGILPGAGGTQRLPRLVGVEIALDMMTSGSQINAKQAFAAGLVDGLLAEEGGLGSAPAGAGPGGVHSSALDALFRVAGSDLVNNTPVAERVLSQWTVPQLMPPADATPCKRSGATVVPPNTDVDAFFVQYHQQHFLNGESSASGSNSPTRSFKGLSSPTAIFKCVQVAAKVSNHALGMQYERRAFDQLAAGTQAKAMQYLFFAEKKHKSLMSSLKALNAMLDMPIQEKLQKHTQQQAVTSAADSAANSAAAASAATLCNAFAIAQCMLDTLHAEMAYLSSAEGGGVPLARLQAVLLEHLGGWHGQSVPAAADFSAGDAGSGSVSNIDLLSRLMFPTINAGLAALGATYAASSSGASPGTGAGAESSPEINSQVSPEQVDLIFVHALGWGQFPRHKGGPFFWAEQEIGLAPMALRLKELKEEHPLLHQYVSSQLLMDVVQSQSSLKEDLYFRTCS